MSDALPFEQFCRILDEVKALVAEKYGAERAEKGIPAALFEAAYWEGSGDPPAVARDSFLSSVEVKLGNSGIKTDLESIFAEARARNDDYFSAKAEEEEPEPPKKKQPRGRPGQRVARAPSAHPVPADADHTSGMIAAVDSGLGRYLGPKTYLLWLIFLRLASPSDRHRRVEGLDLTALGELCGESNKERARIAVSRLKWVGMIEVDKPGRFGGGWAKGLTTVYLVHWPTTQRLDEWRARLTEPTTWSQRIPRRSRRV